MGTITSLGILGTSAFVSLTHAVGAFAVLTALAFAGFTLEVRTFTDAAISARLSVRALAAADFCMWAAVPLAVDFGMGTTLAFAVAFSVGLGKWATAIKRFGMGATVVLAVTAAITAAMPAAMGFCVRAGVVFFAMGFGLGVGTLAFRRSSFGCFLLCRGSRGGGCRGYSIGRRRLLLPLATGQDKTDQYKTYRYFLHLKPLLLKVG
jgi:hypothetical protein